MPPEIAGVGRPEADILFKHIRSALNVYRLARKPHKLDLALGEVGILRKAAASLAAPAVGARSVFEVIGTREQAEQHLVSVGEVGVGLVGLEGCELARRRI